MTNYIKFYLDSEIIFKDILTENYLSPQALKLLMLCYIHFPKELDFISVSGLKKLDLFTKTFNYPRTLQELYRAELLTAYPQSKKILYRLSNKGKLLMQKFAYSIMEIDDF